MPKRAVLGIAILLLSTSPARADKHVGKKTPLSSQIALTQVDHAPFTALLQKYVNKQGMVDYAAWKKSAADQKALNDYLAVLSTGSLFSKTTSTARLAFWINAYNAVTLRGILDEYPTSSIRNHTAKVFGYNIWKDMHLYVGTATFSLHEIEHEVLRKLGDPRIHFAIVCASIGCPRLRNEAYQGKTLDAQLDDNAMHFFAQRRHFRRDAKNNRFYVSSILDWFEDDFGENRAARLTYIAPFLPTDAARTAARTGSVDIKYLSYDWALNKQ